MEGQSISHSITSAMATTLLMVKVIQVLNSLCNVNDAAIPHLGGISLAV
jgi:hypothetical protein